MLFYSFGKNIRRNLDVIESSVGVQPAGVRRRSCVCCLRGQEEPFTAMNMERSKVTRSTALHKANIRQRVSWKDAATLTPSSEGPSGLCSFPRVT